VIQPISCRLSAREIHATGHRDMFD